MKNRQLDPKIIKKLTDKTGKSSNTIRKDIAILRRDNAGLPINCVAQIYARKNGISVHTLLNDDEKSKIPSFEAVKPIKVNQQIPKKKEKKRIIEFIKYETDNSFIQDHILETNKAYTAGCYTAAFILSRKIIENLLIDVIRKKYPKLDRSHLEIYFDLSQRRIKDFSIIIKNLRALSIDFGPDKKLLEKILIDSEKFKGDANDKTHSWYHIVKFSKELDEKNVQGILNMIKELDTHIETQNKNP